MNESLLICVWIQESGNMPKFRFIHVQPEDFPDNLPRTKSNSWVCVGILHVISSLTFLLQKNVLSLFRLSGIGILSLFIEKEHLLKTNEVFLCQQKTDNKKNAPEDSAGCW